MENGYNKSMIREFEQQLQLNHYERQTMLPEWAHIFRMRNQIVACIDGESTSITADQVRKVCTRLPEVTGTASYEVKMLTVLFTEDFELMRRVCASITPCWGVSERTGELFLYENQPREVFGMYKILQILSARQQAAAPGGMDFDARKRQNFSAENARAPQGRKESRRREDDFSARTRQTGAAGGSGFFAHPNAAWMTYALVAANTAVFIVLSILRDTTDSLFMITHGALYPNFVLYNGEWYLLFTCLFVHFGILHLLNNMVLLFFLGQQVERMTGHIRFLIIYLLSGIGGAAVSLGWNLRLNQEVAIGGASGAIFGLMGALLVIVLVHQGHYSGFRWQRVLIMVALCIYFGFTSVGVDNAGHIGGLTFGVIVTFLIYGLPYLISRARRR